MRRFKSVTAAFLCAVLMAGATVGGVKYREHRLAVGCQSPEECARLSAQLANGEYYVWLLWFLAGCDQCIGGEAGGGGKTARASSTCVPRG